MTAQPPRALVVFIPGLLGSVLEDDQGVIWGTPRMLVNLLRKERLRGRLAFDPNRPCHASRMVEIPVALGPLFRLSNRVGYGHVRGRIQSILQLEWGRLGGQKPAGALYFPYDWRRDLREVSRDLESAIHTSLRVRSDYQGSAVSRVVLVAHSMGGLVARHFASTKAGRELVSAVISLGSPYLGATAALTALHFGKVVPGIGDLSDAIRTMPSIYQLLPRYRSLQSDDGEAFYEGTEGLDSSLFEAADRFHQEMRRPLSGDTTWLAVAGTGLATRFKGEIVETDGAQRFAEREQSSGDGIVINESAAPRLRGIRSPETISAMVPHGVMQASRHVWDGLSLTIRRLALGEEEIPYRGDSSPMPKPTSIFRVQDAPVAGSPTRIAVNAAGAGSLEVSSEKGDPLSLEFGPGASTLEVIGLEAGIHVFRCRISTEPQLDEQTIEVLTP